MTGILYLPIGIPGSGKSWFGKQHFSDDEIVCMDDYRRILTGDTNSQAENKAVAEIASGITQTRLSYGLDVYFDATNLLPKYWPKAKHKVFIMMTTTHARSRVQNEERDRVVPDHAMDRMIQRYESLLKNWPKEKLLEEGFYYSVRSADFDRASYNSIHGD